MRRFIVAFVAILLALSTGFALASEAPMISAFVRDDCVHCQDAKVFFDEHPEISVAYRDLDDKEERSLFKKVAAVQEISQVTPVFLIDDIALVGFDTSETTGAYLLEILEGNNYAPHEPISFFLEKKRSQRAGETCDEEALTCENTSTVTVPLLGTIDPQTYSLFTLSSILGLIDGFNPCAMAVLVIFLTLLAQVGSRKRMLSVAGLFLAAEAIMYFFILTAWGTLWDFIGLQRITSPLLGVLAVGSGLYFLYRYYNARNVCSVISPEEEGKMVSKMKEISSNPLTISAAIGIIGIAFSVNVIEFACSVGIPQTFTYILEINNLSILTRHAYIFLYILWYMFDDLIVFGLAIWAFDRLSQTEHYVRYSNLIGGILMFALGVLLVFAPHLLVF